MSKRKKTERSGITVAAVLQERARMITRAEAAKASDCWAKPYQPPAEGTVRNLCTRLGPASALDDLRNREREHNVKRFADERRAAEAERANRERLQAVDEEVAAARRAMTLGQRLDLVLSRSAQISDAPAAVLDADRVSGSHGHSGPRPLDSLRASALQEAKALVERLETDLDRATRRAA